MALVALLLACIQHDLYEQRREELDTSDTAEELVAEDAQDARDADEGEG
jgi:hypothetical protein